MQVSVNIRGTRAEIESACEPYGYHPLSLRILAGLIADDRETPGDIAVANQLDITDDVIANKHHVLEVAYNTLSQEQQKLLSTIACFRAPTIYDALKSITSASPSPTGEGAGGEVLNQNLKTLENRGLLHWDRKTNKYDLHPIVRRYAYERLTAPDRTAAHTRLRDYFDAVPKPEKIEKLEDLAPVIELYHHTVQAGQYDKAILLYYQRIADSIYFQFGGYQTAIDLLKALLVDGENKPPRSEKNDYKAFVLNAPANSYGLSGQPLRAAFLFELSNEFSEKHGDKEGVAAGLGNLAGEQISIGSLHAAEASLHQAIQIDQESHREHEEACDRQELGRLLSYCGVWNKAEQELLRSQKVFDEVGPGRTNYGSVNWAFRSMCLLLMARTQPKSEINNLKSAIQFAQNALTLAEETARTEHPNEVDFLRAHWLLGDAYRLNGQLDFAERHLSEALTRDRAINLVMFEADILLDLARLRYDQKNYEEAKSLAEEALTITERCGYVLQGADVNLFLAQFALEQEKDKAKAKEYAEIALKLATCDGPPYYYKVAYEEAERMLEKL